MQTWHRDFCREADPGTWQWSFDLQVLRRFQNRESGSLATVELGGV
jgi:hypothetical protein